MIPTLAANISNQIKGVFYGQAIGDALGLGTEFLSKAQVWEYYPKGLSAYHQIVQDSHRSRWNIGDWTDDTDQFLCICDAILQKEEVDALAFAQELYQWFSGTPMGIGRTVYKTLSLPEFCKYPHRAAELVWKLSKKQHAANGAIMRSSILGSFDYWDYDSVVQNTEKIAKVTHYDPRCSGSSVIITLMIAHILNEGKLLDVTELIQIGDSYDARIAAFIEKSLSPDIEALDLDAPRAIGYTLKAMSAGLWAYFNASSFEEGILAIIHEGGDADSNASVAGSLLGAKFGYDAIPSKYIEGLTKRSDLESRLNPYLDLVAKRLQAFKSRH